MLFRTVLLVLFGISLYHGEKLIYKKCYSTSSRISFFHKAGSSTLILHSCWWFDKFYYLTFFIHQNVCKDLIYMRVQFKLKHLVLEVLEKWMERENHYFSHLLTKIRGGGLFPTSSGPGGFRYRLT